MDQIISCKCVRVDLIYQNSCRKFMRVFRKREGMKMNDARGIKRCRWIQKQRHEGFNVFVPLFRINAFISDESEY